MHPNFRPPRGLVVFLLVFLLTSFALAVDKKRKSVASEASSKTKAKATQKADPKQSAKVERASDKNSNKNKRQLAQQKKKDGEEKPGKKRGQELAAKQREEKADNKTKAKTAKRGDDKKSDQIKEKTAQRRDDKKSEKVAAKKSPPAAKSSAKAATKTELAAAKTNLGSRTTKQSAQREIAAQAEEHKTTTRDTEKSLAKLESKTKSDSKPEPLHQTEKTKELPATKFTLRPITKVMPKVELKFSVARALATTSFDAPPPRDNGPDVIDVIEHDSPEAKRLDDVLRSEMKSLQVSGVPSNSRRKIDLGKMDAERIKQIQEALAKKGYYAGEITGQYDDATSEAMRKFQTEHKVDVTGYATAQSLRLLGLTDW